MWVVVRHSPDYFDRQEQKWYIYPKEGFPISAFDNKEQAELFAKNSTGPIDTYEAIEVRRI